MSKVLIALGSNERQSVHIEWASGRLSFLLGHQVLMSRKLWTPDIKGNETWYMNRLVAGETTLSCDELTLALKAIEKECGRTKEKVTLDADLLLYDDEKYHLKDWPRPYVQRLLGDISAFFA